MVINSNFCKKGDIKYISHLDLMRLFQRALRRADIPVAVSKGFNPHFKISIEKALKLGVESDWESVRIELEKNMDIGEFEEKINRQMPEGIKFYDAKVN